MQGTLGEGQSRAQSEKAAWQTEKGVGSGLVSTGEEAGRADGREMARGPCNDLVKSTARCQSTGCQVDTPVIQ